MSSQCCVDGDDGDDDDGEGDGVLMASLDVSTKHRVNSSIQGHIRNY